jgi:hypothetical protein
MSNHRRDAQRLLDSLDLDILSVSEIQDYNDHRFDDGNMNPLVDTDGLDWYDHGGYLSKQFYIKHPDYVGVLRTAYYYPDGLFGGSSPVLVLDDENCNEIAGYHE